MKKFVNFLSIALLMLIMYTIVPAAYAVEVPGDNHRKGCFLWIDGCKEKADRSCFGGNCHEDPH